MEAKETVSLELPKEIEGGLKIQEKNSSIKNDKAQDREVGEKKEKEVYSEDYIKKLNKKAKKDAFLLIPLLANAEAGSAVLSLPNIFATSGFILSMIYMIFSIAFSFYNFRILIKGSYYTNSISLAQLSQRAYGKGFSILCDICLSFVLIGFLCSYISVTADYIHRGIRDIVHFVDEGKDVLVESWWPSVFRVLSAAIVLFPLSLIRTVSTLNSISSIAILFFIATAIAIFYYFGVYIKDGKKITFMGNHTIDRSEREIPIYPMSEYVPRIISYFSVFFSLYSLQANIPPVLGEMKGSYERRPKNIWISSVGSTSFVAIFYIAVGLMGGMMFDVNCPEAEEGITCWKLDSNILNSFQNVLPMTIIKLLYAIVIFLSYPVMMQPCRVSILGWFKAPSKYTKKGYRYFVLAGFIVTVIALLMSVFIPKIDTAISFFSIIFGCFIYQLLPIFIHIKLPMFKTYYEKRIKDKLEVSQNLNVLGDNGGAIDMSYVSFSFDSMRQSLNIEPKKIDIEERIKKTVIQEESITSETSPKVGTKSEINNEHKSESSDPELEFNPGFAKRFSISNHNPENNIVEGDGLSALTALRRASFSKLERRSSVQNPINDRRGSFTAVFAKRSVEITRQSITQIARKSSNINLEAVIAAEQLKRDIIAENIAKDTEKANQLLENVVGENINNDSDNEHNIDDEEWMEKQDAKMTFAAELNEVDRAANEELAKDPKKQDERIIKSKFIPSIGKYRGSKKRYGWLTFVNVFFIILNVSSLVCQIIDMAKQ